MEHRRFAARIAFAGLVALGSLGLSGMPSDAAVSGEVGPPAAVAGVSHAPAGHCSEADYGGDSRLGPEVLPKRGTVGRQLAGYRRFGKLSAQQFLARHWDALANSWRYPPADGFVGGPDGKPVKRASRLPAGLRIDRYGSEYGAFLAPAGTRYAKRSIPPQSLDNKEAPASCNYRAYRVSRSFKVEAGPIAPAFEQSGRGIQYKLAGSLVPGAPERLNVLWLVDSGYLHRVN